MTYAMVSEFNPFHNGHKLLIDKVKNDDNAVISVTSSSFVQRGDISIINKRDKTAAALNNGVDLVIELPAVYSLTNAEMFGKLAIEIIKATGVADKLFFGSESGDISLLKNAVKALENSNVQDNIRCNMDNGEYYPKAIYNSVKEIYSEEIANIFDGANNILGIEYIKALKDSTIEPVTFKREGSSHDSEKRTSSIAGGSYIREHFSEKELYIPKYKITSTARIENIEKVVIYKLLSMKAEELQKFPDVTEGIENRILSFARENNSLSELCHNIKTKRYTMARIRRILCCILLGITREIQNTPVPYIRALGFNEKGEALLKKMNSVANLPIITNVKMGYDTLNEKGKKIMDIEILATHIWNLARDNNFNMENYLKSDFQQPIIKVKNN